MRQMPNFDPDQFVRTPIYAFEFQFMIGDIRDFLERSEKTIEWQYRGELQTISQRKDLDDYPSGYREHLEESANNRFRVSLALRVRYAAVLALTTSVEWSVKALNMSAITPVPEKRDGTNQTVRMLREFSARTQLDAESTINDYKALVNVRNCIVHSAGLVESYQFTGTLPAAVARLQPGFAIANWHFFGDQVCIERGALDRRIDDIHNLVVELHRVMHEKSLIRL